MLWRQQMKLMIESLSKILLWVGPSRTKVAHAKCDQNVSQAFVNLVAPKAGAKH